jgi:hypothetical protein
MSNSRECARRSVAAASLLGLSVAAVPGAAYGDPADSAPAPHAAAPAPPAPSVKSATAIEWTPQKRLMASAGATAFVLPYLASAIAATTAYPQGDGDTSSRAVLWIPAVGPFIALGDGYDALASFFLVLDGVAQVGGLSLLVYGLVTPAPAHADDKGPTHAQVTFAPTLVHGAPGGTFAVRF